MTSYQIQDFNASDGFTPSECSIIADKQWYAVHLWDRAQNKNAFYYASEPLEAGSVFSQVKQPSISKIRWAGISNKFALLPKEVFENESEVALAESHFFLEDDERLLQDTIYNHGIKNLFVRSHIHDDVQRNTNLKEYHLLSPIISFLPQRGNRVYAIKLEDQVCVIGIREGQLVYARMVDATHEEEVLFYIIQGYKQSNLSPKEHDLYVAGRLLKDSNLYKLLYRFVRNISFLQIPGLQKVNSHVFYDVYLLSRYF